MKRHEQLTLRERQTQLVLNLFVTTADQDYVTARWAFANGLFGQFQWLAAQCLEKYMKAILLFYGQSTKGVGHDLEHIFDKVKLCDKNDKLLPTNLEWSGYGAMGEDVWLGIETELAICHFNNMGVPENRYGNIGLNVTGAMINALDAICLSFRTIVRRKCPLSQDLYEFNSELEFPQDWCPIDKPWLIGPRHALERLYFWRNRGVGETEQLVLAFENVNMAFFENPTRKKPFFTGLAFQGSPIANQFFPLSQLEYPAYYSNDTRVLRAWVQKNIQISRKTKEELEI